jgi:Skp family chaperone for outer membrane proteins
MLKKTLISGAVLALLVGLLFGRDSISYVAASLGLVRDSVREAIPVEFEINRAKRMIKDLEPEIARNMHVIAREEVDLANIRKQVGEMDAGLAKGKGEILRLKSDLERGDSNFVYAGKQYTSKQVETDLAQRFDRHKTKEQTVERLRQIMAAREKGLVAANEKLKEMQSARQQLDVEVANLETRLEFVKVAQTSSQVNFDNSRLSRTKELLSEIKTRIDVAEKLVNAESTYPGEIALDAAETRNITEEVTRHFNGDESVNIVKLD